jgi:hypothetical protein
MRKDSILAAISALLLAAAMFVLGAVMLADAWGLDINPQIVGGVLITALGFVGLSAILWQFLRKLLD